MIYNLREKYSEESVFEVAKILWGVDKESVKNKKKPKAGVSEAKKIMISTTHEICDAKVIQLQSMFDAAESTIYKNLREHDEIMKMDDAYSRRYKANYEAFKEALKQREII